MLPSRLRTLAVSTAVSLLVSGWACSPASEPGATKPSGGTGGTSAGSGGRGGSGGIRRRCHRRRDRWIFQSARHGRDRQRWFRHGRLRRRHGGQRRRWLLGRQRRLRVGRWNRRGRQWQRWRRRWQWQRWRRRRGRTDRRRPHPVAGVARDWPGLLPRLSHPGEPEGQVFRDGRSAQPATGRCSGRQGRPDLLRPQWLLRALASGRGQAAVLLEPQGHLLPAQHRPGSRPFRHRLRPRLRAQQGQLGALLGHRPGRGEAGARGHEGQIAGGGGVLQLRGPDGRFRAVLGDEGAGAARRASRPSWLPPSITTTPGRTWTT